jgi:hypothetical protein
MGAYSVRIILGYLLFSFRSLLRVTRRPMQNQKRTRDQIRTGNDHHIYAQKSRE